jgi:membrane-bound metal-dependent hydrolase YbcI (DUF457 family)
MVGALSPDLDSIVMPFGWDRYLRVHEIGTHTIIGTLACALLTAAVVRTFTRSRYGPLLAAAWLGAASHVMLDLLSSARLRPGWPIVDTVMSLPVVAMADPWLLTFCVAGAVAARFWRTRSAWLALGVIAAFVLAKACVGAIAFNGYAAERDRAGDLVDARAIEAEWASLTGWRIADRTARALRVWQAPANGRPRIVLTWPTTDETSLVTASRRLSTVRNFLRAHELVFAGIVPEGNGRTAVLWSDIRFCWDPDRPNAAQLAPMVRSSSGSRVACALWFGGEFDAKSDVIREVVKVAGFTQSR